MGGGRLRRHPPGPNGKPYPTLARHALRAAKRLGDNLDAALAGREPQPFVYHTLGMTAALGRHRGIADLRGVKVWGFPALWVWRAYYLLPMPRWGSRVRILCDWAAGLVFRPDATTLNLDDLRPEPAATPP